LPIKFAFDEDKALAALSFIASTKSGLTPLFVSKVLFFAEKAHVNRYGRPIIGDSYIAMPRGPVPSTVKNYIDENWDWVGRPENFDRYVMVAVSAGLRRLLPGEEGPNLDLLSETDRECLVEALEFCQGKSADELSQLTHLEKAWRNAPENRAMSYEDFVDDDNPHRAEIVEMMRENAAYGVM